jgi:large subunit ribosomal protein L31
MKDKIHPEYKEATIACVCGNVVHTRSTKPSIHVDICSNCHPFFTGKQKLMDSAGRVEKFAKRYAGKVKPKKAQVQEDAPAKPESGKGEETK